MGREKESQIEQKDNWDDYARRAGIRCAFCSAVLTYEDYKAFNNKCLPCVNATDPST
jgi:hypothetical protein